MSKKIEKLKKKFYIYPKNKDDEIVEYLNALCEKQNEIIDCLNQDQKQPEKTICEKCGKEITSKFVISEDSEDGQHFYHLGCEPDKQEDWKEGARKEIREKNNITLKMEKIVDIDELLHFSIKDVEQLLSERTLEAKIQQLKEDIEQVEMFVPKVVSDTEKYWIPTQILLELEDDLSKLLKESNEDNPNRIKKLQQEK